MAAFSGDDRPSTDDDQFGHVGRAGTIRAVAEDRGMETTEALSSPKAPPGCLASVPRELFVKP